MVLDRCPLAERPSDYMSDLPAAISGTGRVSLGCRGRGRSTPARPNSGVLPRVRRARRTNRARYPAPWGCRVASTSRRRARRSTPREDRRTARRGACWVGAAGSELLVPLGTWFQARFGGVLVVDSLGSVVAFSRVAWSGIPLTVSGERQPCQLLACASASALRTHPRSPPQLHACASMARVRSGAEDCAGFTRACSIGAYASR